MTFLDTILGLLMLPFIVLGFLVSLIWMGIFTGWNLFLYAWLPAD